MSNEREWSIRIGLVWWTLHIVRDHIDLQRHDRGCWYVGVSGETA